MRENCSPENTAVKIYDIWYFEHYYINCCSSVSDSYLLFRHISLHVYCIFSFCALISLSFCVHIKWKYVHSEFVFQISLTVGATWRIDGWEGCAYIRAEYSSEGNSASRYIGHMVWWTVSMDWRSFGRSQENHDHVILFVFFSFQRRSSSLYEE